MGTLSARNLTQALAQAKNIGLVEEPFVIAGLAVTVRNLRPDEHDAIYKECQGLQDVEYMNAWQLGHACRGIVELNGVDLRDVQFVDDEEEDAKGKIVKVKRELHTYLLNNVINTWGREVIFNVYRKVIDAIEAAERRAQEGITFRVQDESAEDKFRRHIAEAKELEDDVPDRIRDTILSEHGYIKRSTVEELEKANEKLASMAAPEPAPGPAPVPTPEPAAVVPQAAPQQAPEPGPPPVDRMAHLLRNRKPLNQQPADEVGVPTPVPTPAVPQVQTSRPTQPAIPVNATPQGTLTGRSAEMAKLEMDADMIGALEGSTQSPPMVTPQTAVAGSQPIPELRLTPEGRFDPKAAAGIIDTPPVGGINPRFRPPPR